MINHKQNQSSTKHDVNYTTNPNFPYPCVAICSGIPVLGKPKRVTQDSPARLTTVLAHVLEGLHLKVPSRPTKINVFSTT